MFDYHPCFLFRYFQGFVRSLIYLPLGGQYCGNECLVMYAREEFRSWVVERGVEEDRKRRREEDDDDAEDTSNKKLRN